MLKKLVIAGAMVTAAAGMGLATPAYAVQANNGDPEGVSVTCQGPNFGKEKTYLTMGDITAPVSAAGQGSVMDLIHEKNSLEFDYKCGNGSVTDVGNKVIRVNH